MGRAHFGCSCSASSSCSVCSSCKPKVFHCTVTSYTLTSYTDDHSVVSKHCDCDRSNPRIGFLSHRFTFYSSYVYMSLTILLSQRVHVSSACMRYHLIHAPSIFPSPRECTLTAYILIHNSRFIMAAQVPSHSLSCHSPITSLRQSVWCHFIIHFERQRTTAQIRNKVCVQWTPSLLCTDTNRTIYFHSISLHSIFIILFAIHSNVILCFCFTASIFIHVVLGATVE